ncbi:MAG: CHAT domain-containing protein [Cyclobacteriaceae bacterium]
MKKILIIPLLLLTCFAVARQVDTEDFYPILKKTETRSITFQGCVQGNCRSGEGVYMTIKSPTSGTANGMRYYKSTIYIFIGTFYKNGAKMVGTEYGFNTKYQYKSGAKKMTPSYDKKLDGTDPDLNRFRNYEGEFVFKSNTYVREGKKGKMHYLISNNELYKDFYADTYNGYINRRFITYKDGYKYKSFEGWMIPGNYFMAGKLVMANGDTYQGTFFSNQYEGYGRLTTSAGIKEGFWRSGEVISEEKITIPEAGLNGDRSAGKYKSIKMVMADNEAHDGDYFGALSDGKPDGQGMTFSYWGYITSGNYKEGKLDGLGYRLTTKSYVKSFKKGDSYFHTRETGIFSDGRLIDGTISQYKLTKGSSNFSYSKTSEKTVVPSSAVLAQNATAEKVDVAGKTPEQMEKEATSLLQRGDYAKALFLYKKLIPIWGYNNRLSAMASFCYLMLKDVENAEKYIRQAQVINNSDYINYSVESYISIAKDNMDDAKRLMDDAMWFHTSNNMTELLEDLPILVRNDINPGGAEAMSAYVKAKYGNRDKSYIRIDETMNKASQQIGQNNNMAKNLYDQGISYSAKVTDKPWLKGLSLYVAGGSFYYNGFYDEAYSYLQRAYEVNQNISSGKSPYVQLFISTILAEFALNTGNLNDAETFLAEADKQIAPLGEAGNDLKAKYYDAKSRLYLAGNNTKMLKLNANKLLNLKGTGYDLYYEALANNYLGNAYLNNIDQSSRDRARSYYEKAFAIAEKNNFEPLKSDIQGNLALSYWQSGKQQQAQDTYRKLVDSYVSRGLFADAEISINNLAFLYFYNKDYNNAAINFKRAVEITEEARKKLTDEQKVAFFQGKLSAYQGLIYSLAKQNKVAEVFAAQQKDRARVLLENLIEVKDKRPVSLSAFQSSLSPGELAIFYSLFEAGQVVITAITDNSATVKVVDETSNFLNLKGRYLDQINKGKPGYNPIDIAQAKKYANVEDRISSQFNVADFNGLMELLRGLIDESIKAPDQVTRVRIIDQLMDQYYKFLIKPVEGQLAGKNKVILFPDGVLNFLPFEAVRPTEGKYLVERMDVRYGRSADVSAVLKSRQYADGRKPFLGMGGAEYNKMNVYDLIDRNDINYNYLKIKAAQNARQGVSQREIYASLFGEKMDYLEGTLKEVNNLSQIFTDATVFKGTDMTENLVKELSRSGDLSNYKIIHLATHGFSLPDFPELSGIAMTIFPAEQDGEDGYLTAPEISNLNMNADLVVLSACETALGKIYGGEGVAGLTQSILEGGANAALVSLWPVNDAGTMYFMTGLYQMTEKEGKSYSDAVNLMKRRFISGEFGDFFKDPKIWAPFIHYGY